MSWIIQSWKIEIYDALAAGRKLNLGLVFREHGCDIVIVDKLKDVFILCTAGRKYSITSKRIVTDEMLMSDELKSIIVVTRTLRTLGWRENSEFASQ